MGLESLSFFRLTISSSSPCVHVVKGSRYALRSAMVNSCRSSRGPWTTVGDGRNDDAPGCGRIEPSESESGVVGVVCPGSRPPCVANGARGRGGGSRSNIDSGRAPGLWSLASRCVTRGGDKAGMYQVDDVSSGRPRMRAGERDLWVLRDDAGPQPMSGVSWCSWGHHRVSRATTLRHQGKVQGVQSCRHLGSKDIEDSHQVVHKLS